MRLTVVHDFTFDLHDTSIEYQRGNVIDDEDVIEAVLKSENAAFVVRTMNGN